jgi:alpha-pyrone synthase
MRCSKSIIDFFSYKNKKNQPIILSLETGVPKYKTLQSDALYYLLSTYKNKNNITYQTIVKNIYKNSRIETRYLGIPDFRGCDGAPVECSMENMENEGTYFFKNIEPIPIQIRLNKCKEIALPLVIDVCSRTINSAVNSANICKKDIHKLIVVSSTGFFGPSLDCDIIKALDLPRTIDRTLIGFMGCAAAINGFRIATDFVNNNPGKCALMVCVEISSVHANFNDSINDTVTHSIFSDGVSACILRAKKTPHHFLYTDKIKPSLAIIDSFSCLMDNT